MASQQQDELVSSTSIDDYYFGCDESKCVSKGRGDFFNGSNTCYGDGYVFPMMCADGFIPKVVADEPSALHVDWWGQIDVSYFTCCPPRHGSSSSASATEVAAVRHCSDPIATVIYSNADEDSTVDDVCANQDQKYPRQMKSNMSVVTSGNFGIAPSRTDSVLCCDAPLPSSNEDANFLDETECVPYRSEFYEFKPAENYRGILNVITCDFPEGSFTVPRPLEGQTYADAEATGRYQCCKSGVGLDPFIKDEDFNITVYLPLALWSIAAAVSVVVIVALLIPLYQQIKKGEYTWSFSSSDRTASVRSFRSRKKGPTYSTYNLYVVYLALFDLIYALFQIGFYLGMVGQAFNPNFRHVISSPTSILHIICILSAQDGPITYTFTNINMWINAVISYQLLVLLRQTKSAKKIDQPSLTKVNTQVGLVFLLSMVYWAILHTLRYISVKAGPAGDFAKIVRISNAVEVIYWVFLLLPAIFICGIACLIWWGGYVPSQKSSTRDKAMRQLFFFFLRILLVFFVIWIPCTILVYYGTVKKKSLYFLWTWILMAIQPILSTCMVLTKFDARKYIMDLVSLSYCLGSEKERTLDKQTSASSKITGISLKKSIKNRGSAISMLSTSGFTASGAATSTSDLLNYNPARSSNSLGYTIENTGYTMDDSVSNFSETDDFCRSVLGFAATDAENEDNINEDAESVTKNATESAVDRTVNADVDADGQKESSTIDEDDMARKQYDEGNEQEEVSERESVTLEDMDDLESNHGTSWSEDSCIIEAHEESQPKSLSSIV